MSKEDMKRRDFYNQVCTCPRMRHLPAHCRKSRLAAGETTVAMIVTLLMISSPMLILATSMLTASGLLEEPVMPEKELNEWDQLTEAQRSVLSNLGQQGVEQRYADAIAEEGRMHEHEWVISAGSSGWEVVHSLDIGDSGEVYASLRLTGGSVTFQAKNGTTYMAEHFGSGEEAAAIARFDSDGDIEWIVNMRCRSACSSHDYARFRDIHFDGDSIIATGNYNKTVVIGENHSTLTSQSSSSDIITLSIDADSGAINWISNAGAEGWDAAYGIVSISNGDVLITGTFNGNLSGDSPSALSSYPNSAGDASYDIFIASINSSTGTWNWVKSVGNSGTDMATSITSMSDGRAAVVGKVACCSLNFDSISTSGSHYGNFDGFIAIIDKDGNWEAVEIIGAPNYADYFQDISIDSNGDFNLIGLFQGTSIKHESGEKAIASISNPVTAVMKLNSELDVKWISIFEGTESVYPRDISSTSGGMTIVTMHSTAVGDLGLDGIGNTGTFDGLILGLDSVDGSVKWYETIQSNGDDNTFSLAVNGEELFLGGAHAGAGALGSPSTDGSDLYIQKRVLKEIEVDHQWVASTAGDGSESMDIIDVDSAGHVYVAGTYTDTLQISNVEETNDGSTDDGFVAKLSRDGAWEWIQSIGGGNTDHVTLNDISVTGDGHLYITGNFGDRIIIDGNTYLSTGGMDGFLSKLTTDGQWVWTEIIGSSSTDALYGVDVDIAGNAYVVGTFTGTVSLGPHTLSSNHSDGFVARIDDNGVWRWIAETDVGSTASDGIVMTDIGLDESGKSFITGRFAGNLTLGSTNLVSQGSTDIFVASLDSDGNWNWASSAGGQGVFRTVGLILLNDGLAISGRSDGMGNIAGTNIGDVNWYSGWVAGISYDGDWTWATSAALETNGSFFFTGIDATSTGGIAVTGYANGYWQMGRERSSPGGFIAELDNHGHWIHATSIWNNYLNDIAVTKDGRMIGATKYTSITNDVSFGDIIIPPSNNHDGVVWSMQRSSMDVSDEPDFLKTGDSRSKNWATLLESTDNGNEHRVYPIDIAVGFDGEVYVGGYFSGNNLTFAGETFLNVQRGKNDLFILKMSPTGEFLWLKTAGTSDDDVLTAIDFDRSGNLLVSGWYKGSELILGDYALPNVGYGDGFIAKLSSDGEWKWAKSLTGNGSVYIFQMLAGSNGEIYIVGSSWASSLSFDGTTYSIDSLSGFIMKLTNDGRYEWLTWAKGSNDAVQLFGLTERNDGGVIVGGYVEGSSLTLMNGTVITGLPGIDIEQGLVLALDEDGVLDWHAIFTSDDDGSSWCCSRISAIEAQENGNIIISLVYRSDDIEMNGVKIIDDLDTQHWTQASLICLDDDDGSLEWVVNAGGTMNDEAEALHIDEEGRILWGIEAYSDELLIDDTIIDLSEGSTDWDVVAVIFDEDGNLLDYSIIDGSSHVYVRSIMADNQGGFFLTGATYAWNVLVDETWLNKTSDWLEGWVIRLNIDSSSRLVPESAIGFGGAGTEYIYSLDIDASGNAYIVGCGDSPTINFGGMTLYNRGDKDGFAASIDPSGNWRWATDIAGDGNDVLYRGIIAGSSTDQSFAISGYSSSSTIQIGNQSVNKSTSGPYENFVTLLDANTGMMKWYRPAENNNSGSSYSVYNGLTPLGDDKVAWSGFIWYADATIDDCSVDGSSSGATSFLVSLDLEQGDCDNVVTFSSSDFARPEQLVATDETHVAMMGYYKTSLSIGSDTISGVAGDDNVFISLVDIENETFDWTIPIKGSNTEGAGGIAFQDGMLAASIYSYSPSLTYDGNSMEHSSSGSYSEMIFMGIDDGDGSLLWETSMTGPTNNAGRTMDVTADGELLFCGWTGDEITFGDEHDDFDPGDDNSIVASMNIDDGTPNWITHLDYSSTNTNNENFCQSIVYSTEGKTWMVGTFDDQMQVGSDTISTLGSSYKDGFLAKMNVDSDGDGISDGNDLMMLESTQSTDFDSDGFGDSMNGYRGDSCGNQYGLSWRDRWGCPDMDGDGTSDLNDDFMQKVTQWSDTDGDSLGDNWADSTLSDERLVNWPGRYIADAWRPDPSPLDWDNDGWEDESLAAKGASGPYDDCPLQAGTSWIDRHGCLDSDGDGYSDTDSGWDVDDGADAFPLDDTQWRDSDGDGYGDNFANVSWIQSRDPALPGILVPNANEQDACPLSDGGSHLDVYGCTDADEDGWSIYSDPFDDDSSEWEDSDDDGYGDNSDACPNDWNGNVSVIDTGVDIGCSDGDADGHADIRDSHPTDSSQWSDTDNDGYGDSSIGYQPDDCIQTPGTSTLDRFGCLDTDRDGTSDLNDDCPNAAGFSNISKDACPDSDADGIPDDIDPDPYDGDGTANDWDADGVPDSDDDFPADRTQWEDNDGDGFGDNQSGNNPDAFVDEVTQWSDRDADGYGDNPNGNNSDACSYTAGNSTNDRLGCPDSDGDGWSNPDGTWNTAYGADAFIDDATQWNDEDGDGYGNNRNGTDPDDCPTQTGTSTMKVLQSGKNSTWLGCIDTDGDGYHDASDPCPFQFGNSWVDRMGCPDADQDGISDGNDPYPNEATNSTEDFDGDGVINTLDSFPADRTQWQDADGDGWGDNSSGLFADDFTLDPTQYSDTDGDGYGDNQSFGAFNSDHCPQQAGNSTLVWLGCPDSDGDGMFDDRDAFPSDSTQYADRDEDGFGDDINGNNPDACPDDEGASIVGLLGCPDTDRDGVPDIDADRNIVDVFAFNPTQWADLDGDGYGDNEFGMDADECPMINGSSTEDRLGCLDTDGDGFSDPDGNWTVYDGADAYPNMSNAWTDVDGDGFSDQPGINITDDCPTISGTSVIPWQGCPDMDRDGIMDLDDLDADNDGISNTMERDAFESSSCKDSDWNMLPIETSHYNSSITPNDLDGDKIPDCLDSDVDGDTFPNVMENERNSDPRDPESTPFNSYMENGGLFYVPGEGFSSQYVSGAYELSISQVIDLLTSEYLIPILMIPLSLMGIMRKGRRYKKIRRKLERVNNLEDLKGAEETLDNLILTKKIKVEHGVILHNLYERKASQMENRENIQTLKNTSRAREDGPQRHMGPETQRRKGPQNPGPAGQSGRKRRY